MTILFMDLETTPDLRPGAREAFIEASRQDFKAPSDLTKEQALRDLGHDPAGEMKFKSKAEVIAMWCDAFGATKCEEVGDAEWRKTSFDATKGQICVIGFAFDDEPAESLQIKEPEDEARILRTFFERLEIRFKATNMRRPIFVGHNHVAFDLPFLYRRAVILGIKPPAFLPINPSPWDEYVFDTMLEWSGNKGKISMDNLCKALGIPGKEGMDGSMVCDAFLNGQIDEIAEYCRDDVYRTRAMYERLTFGKHGYGAKVIEGHREAPYESDIVVSPMQPCYAGLDLMPEPPYMDLIAPGHSLGDLRGEQAASYLRWPTAESAAEVFHALPAVEAWLTTQREVLRRMVAAGQIIELGDGKVLGLAPTARRWKPEAEERLKSFAMKKDEMYHQTLISPEEAEHFFTAVKPSKVRLERLQEVIEDDPDSEGLVAIEAQVVEHIEAAPPVAEEPAAPAAPEVPVEENIDDLF